MSLSDPQTAAPQICMRRASLELERRINSREQLACEAVLELFPELRGNSDSVLELIYLEYLLRQEQGDDQALDSLVTRFPSLQAEIVKLVQVDQAMLALQSTHPTTRSDRRTTNKRTQIAGLNAQFLERIGDYELLEVIGCGGMGVVYRARQVNLDRLVALKTIDTIASFSPTVINRFQSEAELAARLQHPNIVQIHEINSASGIPYFSMELVTGGSLAKATRDAPLQPLVAARLCETLARAVEYAHSQGIIHRDLKPANILLAPSKRQEAIDLQLEIRAGTIPAALPGALFDPKIADFGLAKRLDIETDATQTGTTLGTPSYMAPEQVDSAIGATGPPADIYALGALLYHLLVGRPPFHSASAVETMQLVRHQEPMPLRKIQPKIPVDLETICLTCLQKNPAQRYRSAEALADDLKRFLQGQSIAARASGPVERLVKWARRHPSLALLASTLIMAALATTWLWRRAELSGQAERSQRTRAESLVYVRDISLAHLEFRSNHVDRCEQILQNCDPSQRNWEWNYLKSLCQEHLWETPRYDLPILSTALSPDGSLLACSYGNWGVDRSEPIRIWSLRDRQLLYELSLPACNVHCLQFSSDGRWLLSSGVSWQSSTREKRGGVAIWNVEDGSQAQFLPACDGIVARFLPDGNSFLVGTSSGVIQHYARQSGEKLGEFRGHTSLVLDIAIGQSGKEFFSSAKDRSIRSWDLENGKSTGELTKLVGDDPFELELSPNGERILVAGWAGSLKTYDRDGSQFKLVGSQKLRGLPHNRYTPDGLYLLTASYGEGAELRDVHSGEIVYHVHARTGNIKAIAFDHSGRLLATGSSDGSTRVWDLSNFNRSLSKSTTSGPKIAAIASHPRQPEIALATQLNHLHVKSTDKSIELRRLDRLNQVRTLVGHTDWPTCVAYSQDGLLLVSGSADKTVRLWNVETARPLQVLRGHSSTIIGASFFAAGKKVLSADDAGKIFVWELQRSSKPGDTPDPELISSHLLGDLSQPLTSMSLHADGRYLALGTASGLLEIWDVSNGRVLASVAGKQPIRSLLFSPEGSTLAIVRVGSQTIELHSTAALVRSEPNSLLFTLAGHTDQINSVSFGRDGKRLVSSSRDESIRMFDVSGGHELLYLHVARGLDNLVHLGNRDDLLFAEENRLYCLTSNISHSKSLEQLFDLEDTIAWHEQQLAKAKDTGDSWANVFHRQALAELRPPTAAELYLRGVRRAYVGDLRGALRDIQAALTIEDKRSYHETAAVLHLNLDCHDEYRHACRQMIERTTATGDVMEMNSSLWTAALADQSGIDLIAWTKAVESGYANAMKNASPLKMEYRAAIENTLGLALFRCHRYSEAVERMQSSLKLGSIVPAIDHAVLAMAYSRLERTDDARQSLSLALKFYAEMQQAQGTGLILSNSRLSAKTLQLPLLIKEATDLIDSQK